MTTGSGKDNGIINFNEARAQKLEEKRRSNERVFFKHLLSVYSVVGKDSMFPIEVVDVSEDGCSFQVPYNPDKPWPTDSQQVPLRLYFSQDTFLEVHVTIQNVRDAIDQQHARFKRYGCTVDKTASTYSAYQQFVRFLKAYSEHANRDTGDLTVFYV